MSGRLSGKVCVITGTGGSMGRATALLFNLAAVSYFNWLGLAVPWPRVQEALEGLEWSGQIVIDATNDFEPSDLNGRTSTEVVADLVRGAPVLKAANTLAAAVLGSDPQEASGRRVIFLSGDDIDAKAEVISLFEDAGFFTIDLGALITGGAKQQLGAPLAGVNLIRLSGAD
jgi:predicted dinucleotide-binding enzyme